MERDDIELIEFNDAVVRRFEVSGPGSVMIEFSHLCVYRREGAALFGVWSYRAELGFSDVKCIQARGEFWSDEAESLGDLEFIGLDSSRIDPLSLLKADKFPLSATTVTWALSGGAIVLRGGSVTLRLVTALERIETWSGDLAAAR